MTDLHETNDPKYTAQIDTVGWIFVAPPHSNTSLARPLVIAALLGIFILREHLTLRKATGLVMALAALTALARS